MTDDEWDSVLAEMVDGFKIARELTADGTASPSAEAKLERALDLFGKHFRDLSW